MVHLLKGVWWPLWRVLRDGAPGAVFLGGVALGCLVAVFFGWLFERQIADVIRYAGTSLEVLGVSTVAWKLSGLRRRFGRPSIPQAVGHWFRRLTTVSRHQVIALEGVGGLAIGGTVSADLDFGISPDATMERRIEWLERRADGLKEELKALSGDLRALSRSVTDERRAREAHAQTVERQIEDVFVGDFHYEVIGLWWVVLGGVFANLPAEWVDIGTFIQQLWA
jgi:hypothetical protein